MLQEIPCLRLAGAAVAGRDNMRSVIFFLVPGLVISGHVDPYRGVAPASFHLNPEPAELASCGHRVGYTPGPGAFNWWAKEKKRREKLCRIAGVSV